MKLLRNSETLSNSFKVTRGSRTSNTRYPILNHVLNIQFFIFPNKYLLPFYKACFTERFFQHILLGYYLSL